MAKKQISSANDALEALRSRYSDKQKITRPCGDILPHRYSTDQGCNLGQDVISIVTFAHLARYLTKTQIELLAGDKSCFEEAKEVLKREEEFPVDWWDSYTHWKRLNRELALRFFIEVTDTVRIREETSLLANNPPVPTTCPPPTGPPLPTSGDPLNRGIPATAPSTTGSSPASASAAPTSAAPTAAQPSGIGESYAGTTPTNRKRPREADDAPSVALQAPNMPTLRLILNQPRLSESPTSQPYGIDSRASNSLTALPAADLQPQRRVLHVLSGPFTRMFEVVFPGVGFISNIAKSKQDSSGISAIAHSYIYDDLVTEVEICLGGADEQSCKYAADQVRAILRYPGVSVEVQQVRQMKIEMQQEAIDVARMIDSIFSFK
ncbi:hypothetical protein VTK26DRAFT_2796 [Humicola hyalothermophila]